MRARRMDTKNAGERAKDPGPPSALTPRQRDILRLVALGRTNREIATELDISVRTVEVHRFNLMRRLNARNVAQLLRQALTQGLLPRAYRVK